MILGRIVWGLVMMILLLFTDSVFTFKAFLLGAFINAWIGIVIQIVLIPSIIFALNKAGLLLNEKKD